MNIFVSPLKESIDSSVLTDVVPAATTRPAPSIFALASALTSNRSLCNTFSSTVVE